MNPIFADFNAMTESGQVRLNCRGSQDDLRAADLHPGDWAWLSDGELDRLRQNRQQPATPGSYGVPDWKTLVHLDDTGADACGPSGQELQPISLDAKYPSVRRAYGESLRVADDFRADLPLQRLRGHVPTRLLLRSGEPGRSFSSGNWNWHCIEIEEARRLEQGHPDDELAYLPGNPASEPICHERPARPSL